MSNSNVVLNMPRSSNTSNIPTSGQTTTTTSFNPNLSHSNVSSGGNGGSIESRLSVLETKVDQLNADLSEIKGDQKKYFWGGLTLAGFLIGGIASSYVLLNNRFIDVEHRFVSIEKEVSDINTTTARIEERLNNVNQHVEKIPTKDEMLGIMYQVIHSKEK